MSVNASGDEPIGGGSRARVSRDEVVSYWEANPCSEADQIRSVEDSEFYPAQEHARYELQPFIVPFARFDAARGKRTLEIGVGLGADHINFLRARAIAVGVDITWPAIFHTRRRARREGLTPRLVIADSLRLPFQDGTFDFVYSFGVLHHTPDPPQACAEAARVASDMGTLKLMLYNRRSLLALQSWFVFGLLKGRPFHSLRKLIAEQIESPGTQAYSRRELRSLIPSRFDLQISTVVTPYDCRIGRRRYLPRWLWKFIPSRLGWNHLITGRRRTA